DLEPAITDAPDAKELPKSDEVGHIVFENVTFRYPDADEDSQPIIDSASLEIKPGEFVAIVGPSGSGKTTIGYLTARLYDAVSGSVKIAGHDVKSITQDSLRDNLGIVSQETYLFHAT